MRLWLWFIVCVLGVLLCIVLLGILVVATWFGCGGVGLGCLVWGGDLVFIWCVGFLFTLVWVGGDVGWVGFGLP